MGSIYDFAGWLRCWYLATLNCMEMLNMFKGESGLCFSNQPRKVRLHWATYVPSNGTHVEADHAHTRDYIQAHPEHTTTLRLGQASSLPVDSPRASVSRPKPTASILSENRSPYSPIPINSMLQTEESTLPSDPLKTQCAMQVRYRRTVGGDREKRKHKTRRKSPDSPRHCFFRLTGSECRHAAAAASVVVTSPRSSAAHIPAVCGGYGVYRVSHRQRSQGGRMS